MVIELHIQYHPAFKSLGPKGCISSYWEHPRGLGFGGFAASGYVFSSVTVCCQWLTINGIYNKSSLLTTDAASNSLIHHNGEWLSGAARISILCCGCPTSAHSYNYKCHRSTWSFDSLGLVRVSSFWAPLSTNSFFLLPDSYCPGLYLWFSMQWKFICFPKKHLDEESFPCLTPDIILSIVRNWNEWTCIYDFQ